MKRSWTTYILMGGVAVLLAVLGTLQYTWLSRISAADSEKERQRVSEQASRFADDFNAELQNAYFNLQTDAKAWEHLETDAANRAFTSPAFNERYAFWRSKTEYPGLIKEVYFTNNAHSGGALKYDAATGSFSPTFDAEAEHIRKINAAAIADRNVNADERALILPINSDVIEMKHIVIGPQPALGTAMRRREMPWGELTLILDDATIQQRLLPDLAAKYFGEGQYRVGVTKRDGGGIFQPLAGESRDATAGLFTVSPDKFFMFAAKQTPPNTLATTEQRMVVGSRLNHVVPDGQSGEIKTRGSVNVQVTAAEGRARTTVFSSTGNPDEAAPWTLGVQNISGSIADAASATLRRNLALGFGLLILLAGAIGAVLISTMRVRAFAQRQVDFVSSVSHEFRTPLAVIYSAGENLADGVARDAGQINGYGELIKGEGKKLSGMVEQILDFAGANAGRRKFNFAEVEVADVVRAAIEECRGSSDESGVVIEEKVSAGIAPVRADKRALTQAIQNLIANSIKYSNGSERILVSASNGGNRVKIAVEDHGIGISKDDLKQIFTPFYRSKSVVDAQIHGNGLGLSLVKQIVDAHDGKVIAKSEKGMGSTFTIELPTI